MMLSQMDSITTSPIAEAAPKAFEMAGVSHGDIDLISVYDCYTITVLITLEDAGFCPKGKGGPFVEEHDFTWRGDLPLNTHGGQLSFGQPGLAGGMSHVTEAVRQLQGRAGERQVKRLRDRVRERQRRDHERAGLAGARGRMSGRADAVPEAAAGAVRDFGAVLGWPSGGRAAPPALPGMRTPRLLSAQRLSALPLGPP